MNEIAAHHRPTGWEWTQLALIAANLCWTTLCLGGYRPETMVITTGLTGLTFAVHVLGRGFGGPSPGPTMPERNQRPSLHPAGVLLLPFLVYAGINVVTIAPMRWLGWRDWLGWANMIAVFWIVLNSVRSRLPRAVLIGTVTTLAVVAVLLGCYQRFVRPDWLMLGRTQVDQFVGRASGPFGIPNSLAALLLLVLPLCGVLTFRRGASALQRVFFGYLTAVLAFGLVLTVSRGGWIALVLVLMAWPWLGMTGIWWRRAGVAVVVALVVGVAGTVVFRTVPIARERLMRLYLDAGEQSRPILWRGAVGIIREHPVWGSGAGSFNSAFERHRPVGFVDEPRWAHNEYLNTASDYGLAGFGLFFGACGIIAWRCRRAAPLADGGPEIAPNLAAAPRRRSRLSVWATLDDRCVRQGIAAGAAAFFLQLFVDFHLKIPALAMAAASLSALWVQSRWVSQDAVTGLQTKRARANAVVVALSVLGLTWFFAVPHFRAEALRYGAREQLNRLARNETPPVLWSTVLDTAEQRLEHAVAIDASNGAAWSDLSYVTALRVWLDPARAGELGRRAEIAAQRALGCAAASPEAWVRRGVARDLQRRHVEAGGDFVEALRLAPAQGFVWYHHAFHLSLDPSARARALGAVTFSLRLDGGNRQAQALRDRLASPRPAP